MGRSANGESKLARGLTPGRTAIQNAVAERDARAPSRPSRSGPAKGTAQGAQTPAYSPPQQVDPEQRAASIAARLSAAKAATGQDDSNPNGTTNAASTGVGRYSNPVQPDNAGSQFRKGGK
jgi:hypothetical protein